MEEFKIEEYSGKRDATLINQLVAVWNISVRTSHDFLTEEDITGLFPHVEAALKNIERLVIVWEGHIPIGFMGIQERKIEMLFLSLSCIGKGIGKELVNLATGKFAAEYVDVNEQNDKAQGFYRHMGFRAFQRDEADGQGNPFPIIHMRLHKRINGIPAKGKILIRRERPADYRDTEHVVREAFWNYYSPGCTEHYLLHIMRNSPNFVTELDFVAESDGKIIGSIAFMKSIILGDNGKRYEVLTLGPIAVLPAFQRRGAGRLLISHAISTAKGTGHRAILLCGDPLYYTKAGFTAAEHFGIRTSENKYSITLQACPLYEDALKNASGRYIEDEIYFLDEKKALEFDRLFPPKERIAGTRTQQRFKEISAMQKDHI